VRDGAADAWMLGLAVGDELGETTEPHPVSSEAAKATPVSWLRPRRLSHPDRNTETTIQLDALRTEWFHPHNRFGDRVRTPHTCDAVVGRASIDPQRRVA